MTVAQRRSRSLKWSRSHHYRVSFANPASGTSSSASHSGTRVSTHCHRFDKEPSLSPLRPSSRRCHLSRGNTHTHLFLFELPRILHEVLLLYYMDPPFVRSSPIQPEHRLCLVWEVRECGRWSCFPNGPLFSRAVLTAASWYKHYFPAISHSTCPQRSGVR